VTIEQFLSLVPQSLVNGLTLGGTLALVALGFSIVWGILNIINLAHGAYLMLSAYLTYYLFESLRVDPFVSVIPAMALFFVVGYGVQRFIINNVIRAPLLVTFLLTFGIEIILINVALNRFGGDFRSVATTYRGAGFEIGNVRLNFLSLGVLAVSLALVTALVGPRFVDWTKYRTEFETNASHLIDLQVRASGPLALDLLPTAALSSGLRDVLQRGAGLSGRDVLALLGWAAAALTAATRFFRWE